jgi:hypothetical protein
MTSSRTEEASMSHKANPVHPRSVNAAGAAVRALLAVVAGLLALPAALLVPAAGAATGAGDPVAGVDATVYYPPDVVGQFNALSERADAFGFGIGPASDPSPCRHYQGMARSTGPGVPHLFVTHNGNHNPNSCPFRHDYPGELLVVQMASRSDDGERLRSNRIQRDKSTVDTPPASEDTTVAVVRFDGRNGWPAYHHPGGVQLVGDVLAVPLEGPCPAEDAPEDICADSPEGAWPAMQVVFIDVSDPTSPQLLSSFTGVDVPSTSPREFPEFSAGLVALTPTPGGRYLMAVTGKSNDVVRFFRSKPTEPDGTTNLASSALDWELVFDYFEDDIEDDIGTDWPGDNPFPAAYQTMNFVREGGPSGQLFVAATRNTSYLTTGSDEADLYRVTEAPGHFTFQRVARRHLVALPTAAASSFGQGDIANFAAASGFYVSPSGELILYATEHENQGPNGTVKAGEWRNHDMVRPGSSTLRPSAAAGGPYTVGEGGTVALSGAARPPATRAWIELFADENFQNRSVVIDHPDYGLDDFDNFNKIEANEGDLNRFSDDPQSIRWFAPPGCKITLNDHHVGAGGFPGEYTRTLQGDGNVHAANLKDVRKNDGTGNIAGKTSSVTWDCPVYDAGATLTWDLDGDGTFGETGETGANPTFSAAGLDGPATRTVAARACAGVCSDQSTTVTVTNVNPSIASVSNSGPVNEGSSATIAVTATDPAGAADPLSYSFDCGDDGTFEVGPQVESSASCTFADEGTNTVRTRVTDGDSGLATGTTAVSVVNVAPVITATNGPTDPVRLGAAAAVGATFTDPGTGDAHSCTFTWDDGQPATTVAAPGTGSGSCSASHTYTAAGVYTVGVTVADGDGGTSTPAKYEFVVVFNPAGGFVTGAGAITSPPGAYAANPTATGRANFAFVSEYRKGATTPSGQTQFRFKAGDLVVDSETYQWLVVAGAKAQYKGTARVNGTAGYGFLLSATDGDQPGGGGQDRFRIKVWETATGTVVYDNVRGSSDDVDSASPQALENGSITVHKA